MWLPSVPREKTVGEDMHQETRRAEIERAFLDASIAVWREIDRRSASPGGYSANPLLSAEELRAREREAWNRYRDMVLDACR